METKTYRSDSTWFLHHLDPILRNNFSCRSESTEKLILAVTDSNKKREKSSIGQVEEELFCIDTMAITVSGPSQATIPLARKTPQDLYYECLDEGEARRFSTPNLLYNIDMQVRYAAARATVLEFTLPVPISKKTSSPYGNSDEDSDSPPPSPKRTDATEMKTDKSLQIFIDALPHLEPLHYGFKLQALNLKGYCFCPLAKCLSPWRKNHHVDNVIQCVGQDIFKVLVFFKIRVMNITQQLPFILQQCLKREWD